MSASFGPEAISKWRKAQHILYSTLGENCSKQFLFVCIEIPVIPGLTLALPTSVFGFGYPKYNGENPFPSCMLNLQTVYHIVPRFFLLSLTHNPSRFFLFLLKCITAVALYIC